MKVLKRMAILALVVLALGGCTQNSLERDAEKAGAEAANEEVDPDKIGTLSEDDETLARKDNKLIEDETYETTMYEWEQVKSETDDMFFDKNSYPLSSKMEFTADEDAMTIDLIWVLTNDANANDAMEYASEMVRRFNDIVAVQSLELTNSSDKSFGGLWEQFALNLKVSKEDGTVLMEKSYKAGETIDLIIPKVDDNGPKDVEEDVVKKI